MNLQKFPKKISLNSGIIPTETSHYLRYPDIVTLSCMLIHLVEDIGHYYNRIVPKNSIGNRNSFHSCVGLSWQQCSIHSIRPQHYILCV